MAPALSWWRGRSWLQLLNDSMLLLLLQLLLPPSSAAAAVCFNSTSSSGVLSGVSESVRRGIGLTRIMKEEEIETCFAVVLPERGQSK